MTDPVLTDAELEEMERRAEAASSGPWWVEPREYDPMFPKDSAYGVAGHSICRRGNESNPHRHLRVHLMCNPNFPEQGQLDMQFAAHARSDVPRLIAEVRRLRAEAAGGEGR